MEREEDRIILEAAAVALESSNPDLEAIRDMIAQADRLLANIAMRPSTGVEE